MLALSRLAVVLETDEDEEALKVLQNAIPQMVAVLKQAVDEGDEDRTTQSFEVCRRQDQSRSRSLILIVDRRSSKLCWAAIRPS